MQGSPSQQHLVHLQTSTQVADRKQAFRDLYFVWSEAFVALLNYWHKALESNDWASTMTRTVSHPDATGKSPTHHGHLNKLRCTIPTYQRINEAHL